MRLRLKESDIVVRSGNASSYGRCATKELNTNLLPRMPALFTAFSNTFSTDLSIVQMITLMQFGVGLDSSMCGRAGLRCASCSYTTEQGASVLVINDPARVREVVDGIWNAPAMVDAWC